MSADSNVSPVTPTYRTRLSNDVHVLVSGALQTSTATARQEPKQQSDDNYVWIIVGVLALVLVLAIIVLTRSYICIRRRLRALQRGG